MSEIYDEAAEIHETIAATSDEILVRWVLIAEWMPPAGGRHRTRWTSEDLEQWEMRGLLAEGLREESWVDLEESD